MKSWIRLWLYTPGLWVILWYRFGRSLKRIFHPIIFRPLLWSYEFFYFFLRLFTGIDVPLECEIGEGFYIGHYGGIIVHPRVRIGQNCNLSQGVTIGEGGRGADRGVPIIGDRVYIGPGAKIFGAIKIGDNVAIGANAVVNKNAPGTAVIGGVPGVIIDMEGSRDFIVVPADRQF
jgi:serine O-acetyltransferase